MKDKLNQPVVGVSWEEAKGYCEWANLRLPSEAEWEYACRAGTKTPYASGSGEEDLRKVGWYRGNSEDRLHPVCELDPNWFGLFDMHGNAWEWCEDDCVDGALDYSESSKLHPEPYKFLNASHRVIRGGSFSGPVVKDPTSEGPTSEDWAWSFRVSAFQARSANRRSWRPGDPNDQIGFRPARGSQPGDLTFSPPAQPGRQDG